mmetsp:Transcript_32400/g.75260  ORF Transcript_32400/g.75260 Transcript_32400/m.75260 type:complete len:529 (+) Transcript_32400:169-1755(+)
MPPKGVPSLTREQLLSLEDDMIAAYRKPGFQRKLREAWDAAGDDPRAQVKARQEVCLPAQLEVITKYGFEASLRGVNRSVAMYTKLQGDPEFGIRGEILAWLINPSKQREARRLDIVIGANQYSFAEVLEDYTVGYWKQQLEKGILGTKVLYAASLVCSRESIDLSLEDHDVLPSPPDRICIVKPGTVVKMLELALKGKLGEPGWNPRMGDFRVKQPIGRGAAGVCVYSGEHIRFCTPVAVKWPAKPEEAHALLHIHKCAPSGCRGLVKLWAYGSYEDKQYIVNPLLGSTLAADFKHFLALPTHHRWQGICTVGQIVLQRLETLHRCGYVHCDVSPENVLHGSDDDSRSTLFLIDLGLARRFPGGRPLQGHFGSAEWSSIRSANGGERRPEDDLEALGWVLVHAMAGEPPWVRMLKAAYADWSSAEKRDSVVKQVSEAKLQLLESGWAEMGSGWDMFAEVPEELFGYLRACRTEASSSHALPDYSQLRAFLGSSEGVGLMDVEATFENHILPFLRHSGSAGPVGQLSL